MTGGRDCGRNVTGMLSGPRNPFLADSGNAMAHARCDQQDNTPGRGPEGPTEILDEAAIQYAHLGPGHFSGAISGPYPDGSRVIWSNGRQAIAKLGYDTLEVLATIPTGTEPIVDRSELEALEAGLDTLDGDAAVGHAIGIAARFMTGLDGVYSLLDCDHTLFLGRKDHAAAYVETDRSDPAEPHRGARPLAPARGHGGVLRGDEYHLRRPAGDDHRPRLGDLPGPRLQRIRRDPVARRRHRRR